MVSLSGIRSRSLTHILGGMSGQALASVMNKNKMKQILKVRMRYVRTQKDSQP